MKSYSNNFFNFNSALLILTVNRWFAMTRWKKRTGRRSEIPPNRRSINRDHLFLFFSSFLGSICASRCLCTAIANWPACIRLGQCSPAQNRASCAGVYREWCARARGGTRSTRESPTCINIQSVAPRNSAVI